AQSLFQRELIFLDEDFDLLQNRIYRCVSDCKKTAGFIISGPASHSIGTYGDLLHRDTTFSGLHDTGGRASGSVNPAGQIDEAALTGKRKRFLQKLTFAVDVGRMKDLDRNGCLCKCFPDRCKTGRGIAHVKDNDTALSGEHSGSTGVTSEPHEFI